ncbi:MAG: hypothetical protein Q9M91_05015 [Candidatus Dojkabacteria bacterium]|nr:hypothetical protein [Candidatus Dojkabacteria bacterium]MDQ7021168.1 hypothetical protein [Candidatus Dojkabacteria bacterium]
MFKPTDSNGNGPVHVLSRKHFESEVSKFIFGSANQVFDSVCMRRKDNVSQAPVLIFEEIEM